MLVLNLLDLVLQNLQLTLFVFELVRVDVDFSLEASGFTLMNGIVPATHRNATCN